MTMEWLFGREGPGEMNTFDVQPRAFDIDIVRDVYRMFEHRAHSDLEDARKQLEIEPGQGPDAVAADEYRLKELEARQPVIHAGRYDILPEPPRPVPVDELGELGAYERSLLSVLAGGVRVVFHSRALPVIEGATEYPYSNMVPALLEKLRADGRRRLPWHRALLAVPYLLASAISVLAVWALVDAAPPAPATWLVLLAVVFVWVATIVLAPSMTSLVKAPPPGHRIREGARADVRQRLANGKATAIVSLFTVPAGALIAWIIGLLTGV